MNPAKLTLIKIVRAALYFWWKSRLPKYGLRRVVDHPRPKSPRNPKVLEYV